MHVAWLCGGLALGCGLREKTWCVAHEFVVEEPAADGDEVFICEGGAEALCEGCEGCCGVRGCGDEVDAGGYVSF